MIAYVDSPQGTVLLGVDTARGQTVRIGATGGSPPGEDTSPEGGTDEADQGGCRSEGPTRAPDQSSSDLEKATFATNQAYGVINDILLRIAASGGARTAVGPVPASPNIDGIAIRPATATPTPTATPTSTPTPTPAATPTPTPPPVTLSIPYIAVGPGSGTLATGVYGPTGNLLTSFSKFPGFTGEVRVATGDVNGDGRLDIIGGQGSMSAWVRALSGMNQTELFAYDAFPGFTGGIYVAAGDINGDGRDDVIVGAGPGGGGQVKVFSGMDNALIRNFNAYAAGFTGGVRVAAGDIDNDGRADIVTGPSSGGPTNVKVFSGATGAEIRSFVAYTGFTGGVFVAAGDVNGDGSDDIITGADSGGAPHVKIFSGVNPSTELASFNAFSPSFTGGVRVSGGDVNRDGLADVVVGTGPGGLARVIVFNVVTGTTFVDFVPYDDVFRPEGSGFEGGIYVTAAAPTPVRVSGSVTTPDGRGLRNAIVFLTDPQMVTRQTTTSSFGFFTFENVPAGGPYNLRVNSRRYRFVSRTVTLNGDLTNVNFVGIE